MCKSTPCVSVSMCPCVGVCVDKGTRSRRFLVDTFLDVNIIALVSNISVWVWRSTKAVPRFAGVFVRFGLLVSI